MQAMKNHFRQRAPLMLRLLAFNYTFLKWPVKKMIQIFWTWIKKSKMSINNGPLQLLQICTLN